MNSRISLFCLLLGSAGSNIRAQAVEPAPPSDNTNKIAHVRVWTMLSSEKSKYAVRFKSDETEPVNLFTDAGEKPVRGYYADIPKGKGEVSVTTDGEPVASVKVELLPDDYRTVLVFRKNGKVNAEVLQDPLPEQKNFRHAVRLFNFGTDRVANVSIGNQPPITVPDNEFVVAPITEKGALTLKVNLPDPAGGPSASSITDININTNPSWSVLIVPDYRGKLRPRVSADGRD